MFFKKAKSKIMKLWRNEQQTTRDSTLGVTVVSNSPTIIKNPSSFDKKK
jgi:hypothetical protein